MKQLSKTTDKIRMDFLQRQHWTRWVGYDTAGGHVVWPVFSGDDFRAEIDKAIEATKKRKDMGFDET
jgi:hypothetical protein